MPSPETDTNFNGEDPGLLLSRPAETGSKQEDHIPPIAPRRGRWLRVLLGLLVAVPIALTGASALTSPPHVKGVPSGRLIYLEADEPSDHTTLLRGLRVMGPDGASRQLLHETEPQDRDAGSREWISQPTASPDGHWLAFEKQVITLQEEEQSIDNQLWVMPLTGPGAPPRMLLDLTKRHLKQFLGLAWTPDSRQIVFLNDASAYKIAVADGAATVSPLPISGLRPPPSIRPDISATRHPIIRGGKGVPGLAFDTGRQEALRADSPDGSRSAGLTEGNAISVAQTDTRNGPAHGYAARWGWSLFGGRRVTALKWSPDGKYLAYSVSKPPLEDELFFVDLATGKCSQLPVRTGRAGWDWAR